MPNISDKDMASLKDIRLGIQGGAEMIFQRLKAIGRVDNDVLDVIKTVYLVDFNQDDPCEFVCPDKDKLPLMDGLLPSEFLTV